MGLFARRKPIRQPKVAAASPVNGLDHLGSDHSWIAPAKPLLWIVAWSLVVLSIKVNAENADGINALWLGIAFDILGPVAVAYLASARVRRMWTICFCFALCSVAWSLVNALNSGAHGTFGAERQAQHAAELQEARKVAIKNAETELSKLVPARPAVAIEADINAVLKDPRSENCEELGSKFAKTECPKVTGWRKELGTAKARDDLAKKLADLRAEAARAPPVAAVEAYVEFTIRAARRIGVEADPDTVRLLKTLLFVIFLEFGKTFAVAFVSKVAPRSWEGQPERVSALPEALAPPARALGPPKQGGRPEPATWLLDAFAGDDALPEGIERRNGGLYGPYSAFAAVWGMSPAKAQRMGRGWQEAGLFTVISTPRGTWIGPARRQLRAV